MQPVAKKKQSTDKRQTMTVPAESICDYATVSVAYDLADERRQRVWRGVRERAALSKLSGEIQKHRLAKGWSQAELGRATHLKAAVIRRIESKRRRPTRDEAWRLKAALGFSTND